MIYLIIYINKLFWFNNQIFDFKIRIQFIRYFANSIRIISYSLYEQFRLHKFIVIETSIYRYYLIWKIWCYLIFRMIISVVNCEYQLWIVDTKTFRSNLWLYNSRTRANFVRSRLRKTKIDKTMKLRNLFRSTTYIAYIWDDARTITFRRFWEEWSSWFRLLYSSKMKDYCSSLLWTIDDWTIRLMIQIWRINNNNINVK